MTIIKYKSKSLCQFRIAKICTRKISIKLYYKTFVFVKLLISCKCSQCVLSVQSTVYINIIIIRFFDWIISEFWKWRNWT